MLSPALSPRALSEESKRKIFPLSWLSKNLSMRRWFCEVGVYLHCVSKNDTALACCNFDLHQTILILFGRNVGTVFFISPNYCFCTKQDWRSSASALPGKTRKHENRIFFHSDVVLLLFQSSTSRCLISSVLLTWNSYSCWYRVPKCRN